MTKSNTIEVSVSLPAVVENNRWLQIAQSYEIDSQHALDAGAEDLLGIKERYNEIDSQRKKKLKPIDEARRKIQEKYRPPLEMLLQAEDILKRAMLAYNKEQEHKRREFEAKLREEARLERERLENEARNAQANGQEDIAQSKREEADEIQTPLLARAII
ncbi:MAG: hypothetical protein ACREA4_11945, partial [Nitrososphaera sp.]